MKAAHQTLRGCLLTLIFAGMLLPVAAWAQLEDIVVTAQRRAESMQDVPIAMSAFGGDELQNLGVLSAEDVLNLVPNAGNLPQGGAKQNFFIRGVGTADFHLNVVGAVGVFLDDTALNSPFSVSFSTFDIDRVEVLRGPQNILFGRNTTGGAVNYISRKPDPEASVNGYVRAGIGRFEQLDIEGAIGFPLGDTAAMRVAAVSNTRDGPFNNLTLGRDAGERDSQAARALFLWQPADDWEVLVNVHGGRGRGDPNPFKNVGFQDPSNVMNPCAVPMDQIIPQNNPNCADSSGFVHQWSQWEDVYGNLEHREDLDYSGGSLKLEWTPGGYTITSITAIDTLEIEYNEDADGAPTTIFQFYQEGDYDQWTQELRVTSPEEQSLRWIAGFYYFLEEAEYSTVVRRTPDPFAPSGPDMFNIVPNTQVQQDNEVFALFGQVEFDATDELKFTLGFRWTNETKEGTNDPSVGCVGTMGGPPFCPSVPDDAFMGRALTTSLPTVFDPPLENLDGDWDEWGGRFSVDYQVTDNALLYGSISRGFKGGGFSIAALQALQGLAAEDVNPEVLWAYEVGFKSDLFEDSVRLNGALFYYDWEDLQSFQPLVDPISGVAIPQLTNVPESELIGAEIELTWVPEESWLITAGLGLLDSEIRDPGTIAGVDKGNVLPNSPDVTFNGVVRKDFQIGESLLGLQGEVRYRDDVTYDLANAPNLSQESFWLLNARAFLNFGANEQYEISVWAENLTEEEFCNGATSLAGLAESNLCLPSLSEVTYGVRGTIRFE